MKLGKLYVCALACFMGLGFSSCSDDNNGGTANPGTDADYIGKAVGNFWYFLKASGKINKTKSAAIFVK